MSRPLENKVVAITGAGRGIGKAIAISYVTNGGKICCLSRSRNEINDTADFINKNDGSAIALTNRLGKCACIAYLLLKIRLYKEHS